MSAIAEPLSEEEGALKVFDVSLVPDEPSEQSLYQHKPHMWRSALELFHRGEVIFTLAERDIRAQYKQAVLGVAWALLTPLVSLALLFLLAKNVKGFSIGGGVPLLLTMYVGLITFGLFGGTIGGGSNSLVANKSLMAKSHFPRECFPLSQVLGSAFTSLMATVPLAVIFLATGFAPKLTSFWAPLYVAIEIPFMVGVVLFVSSVIVQMRDLQQIIPIFMPLLMLITVLKPLSQEAHHKLVANPTWVLAHGWYRDAYSLINPMAPIVDNVRASVLLGFGPQWGLLGLALGGSLIYLVGGYVVFKKLEVNFADLA
jgi:ABC-2 type transport system permease protein/lipopolysaccharide transport system permease protein